MSALATTKQLNREVSNLVQRARVGDQNAVAMIMEVRRSAEAGSKRAVLSLKAIKAYIQANPATNTCRVGFGCTPATQRIINRFHSRMGADPANFVHIIVEEVPQIDEGHLAAVPLANFGSLLTDRSGKRLARTIDGNPRIKGILNKLNPECRVAFVTGMTRCNQPIHKLLPAATSEATAKALHIGRAVGLARKIQAVRLPHVSIAAISPMAAWELGE